MWSFRREGGGLGSECLQLYVSLHFAAKLRSRAPVPIGFGCLGDSVVRSPTDAHAYSFDCCKHKLSGHNLLLFRVVGCMYESI